jgi:hypothetical protein
VAVAASVIIAISLLGFLFLRLGSRRIFRARAKPYAVA